MLFLHFHQLYLMEYHEEKAFNLYEKLDRNFFLNKFKQDNNYIDKLFSIFNIKLFDKNLAREILEIVITRINKEQDLEIIGDFFYSISDLILLNPNYVTIEKIQEREVIQTDQVNYTEAPVRYPFWSAFTEVKGSEEINILLKQINYRRFANRFSKERDLDKITSFLSSLNKFNNKKTLESLNHLGQNALLSILSKDEDKQKTQNFLKLISKITNN